MCVGEMYAFGVTVERITTVVSRTSAELFELNVKELRKCLFEKPELFVKMKTEAMEKLQQLRSIHGTMSRPMLSFVLVPAKTSLSLYIYISDGVGIVMKGQLLRVIVWVTGV